MSREVRKLNKEIADALVTEVNKLKCDALSFYAVALFHAEATSAITEDDATVDGYATSSVALVNTEVTAYNTHRVAVYDGVSNFGAHYAADSTHTITAPVATDLTSAITRANDLKAKFNLHILTMASHAGNADTVNTVTATNASDEASLVTLVNQIKSKMNSHFAAAMSSQSITLVDP